MDDLNEDVHEDRQTKPEKVTVYLIVSFLQYTLNFYISQQASITKTEVRPRVKRKKTTGYISKNAPITTKGDGGVYLIRQIKLKWKVNNPYLALFKVKRAFKYIRFEETTGSYIPYVLNKHLA